MVGGIRGLRESSQLSVRHTSTHRILVHMSLPGEECVTKYKHSAFIVPLDKFSFYSFVDVTSVSAARSRTRHFEGSLMAPRRYIWPVSFRAQSQDSLHMIESGSCGTSVAPPVEDRSDSVQGATLVVRCPRPLKFNA